MGALTLECTLPPGLFLPPGEYPQRRHPSLVLTVLTAGQDSPRMRVAVALAAPEGLTDAQKAAFRLDESHTLLLRINRLLRWHRAINQRPNVRELTLAQASPFQFFTTDHAILWGEFVAVASPVSHASAETTRDRWERIHAGFFESSEPPVEELLLLDARQALNEGRFREAVLLGWSVIDSDFNRNFDRLARTALANEWPDALRFTIGNDFGLRNKMTVGMKLIANRSFFDEPNDLWIKLSESYKARNRIIHEGALATEQEAIAAVAIAQQVIAVMSSL